MNEYQQLVHISINGCNCEDKCPTCKLFKICRAIRKNLPRGTLIGNENFKKLAKEKIQKIISNEN